MTRPFHIVDVFAEQPYSGNQLAVVLDADGLSDEAMQQIAAETNYSETTFVSSAQQSDGGFAVRIFTPSHELAFAGHPILGTAWIVRHHIPSAGGATVRLNTGAGPIRVDFEQDLVWFAAPPMSLGAVCRREQMAAALGISPTDIETKGPIQQVSAGTSAVIVPLASLDALHRSCLDLAAFAFLAAEGFPPLIYLFCRETRDPANQLSARFFFESHGVREDPATGNGAAFLGAYLLEHRLLPGDSLSLRIEQGYEMRRPSLILLRAETVNRTRKISVGGKVIPVVQGELL